MSDLRLFDYKKNTLEKKQVLNKQSLKDIIINNLEQLLGITFIGLEISFSDFSQDKIEVLGYDENLRLTIIEFRTGKFSGIINKSLIFLDSITQNLGKVKSILNEKLGFEMVKNLNLSPRLIIIGEDFNQYDEYALKQMPYVIELIKIQAFEKQYLLLEKIYQSKKSYGEGNFSTLWGKQIIEFVLSLGDEVVVETTSKFVCFRKIKAFAYLFEQEGLQCNVLLSNKYKTITIRNEKDLAKLETLLEQSYDEN